MIDLAAYLTTDGVRAARREAHRVARAALVTEGFEVRGVALEAERLPNAWRYRVLALPSERTIVLLTIPDHDDNTTLGGDDDDL